MSKYVETKFGKEEAQEIGKMITKLRNSKKQNEKKLLKNDYSHDNSNIDNIDKDKMDDELNEEREEEESNEEKLEVLEAFSLFDHDGSGSIDKNELNQLLMELNVVLTENELEDLITKLDEDKSGDIDFDEFYVWYEEEREKGEGGESTSSLFRWLKFFYSVPSMFQGVRGITHFLVAKHLMIQACEFDVIELSRAEFRKARPPSYPCPNCFQTFITQDKLNDHVGLEEYHTHFFHERKEMVDKYQAVWLTLTGPFGRRFRSNRLLFHPDIVPNNIRYFSAQRLYFQPLISDPSQSRLHQIRMGQNVEGFDPSSGKRPGFRSFGLHHIHNRPISYKGGFVRSFEQVLLQMQLATVEDRSIVPLIEFGNHPLRDLLNNSFPTLEDESITKDQRLTAYLHLNPFQQLIVDFDTYLQDGEIIPPEKLHQIPPMRGGSALPNFHFVLEDYSGTMVIRFEWWGSVKGESYIIGDFTQFTPKRMIADEFTGIYYFSTTVSCGLYRFHYIVDGKKVIIPYQLVIDDGSRGLSNVIVVHNPIHKNDPSNIKSPSKDLLLPSGATLLENIDLSNQGLGDDGIWSFSRYFGKYHGVKKINLNYNMISDDGMEAFSPSLFQNSTIRELKLTGNKIGYEGMRALSIAILPHQSLRVLELAYNPIGDDGVEMLSNSIIGHCSLRILNLDSCGIHDDGITHLSQALYQNCTIVTLTLRNNCIEERGAIEIAGMLRQNVSIQHLYLSYNPLRAQGVQQIGSSLGKSVYIL